MPKYNYSKGGFVLPFSFLNALNPTITATSIPNWGSGAGSLRGGLYYEPPYLPNSLGGNVLLPSSRYFQVGSHGYGYKKRRKGRRRR